MVVGGVTDSEIGKTEIKEVVQTFEKESTELIHISVAGNEIVCTNEHPFYSPVKGWTAACKLRAGDVLVTVNGELVVVEWVQHELLENPIKVYNFEVEGFHTYYVGDDGGVLVHNKCNEELNPAAIAKELGYIKIRGVTSHVQAGYKNAKAKVDLRYITCDIDSHIGGFWKGVSTMDNLRSKATISGTYSIYLRWLGK